MPTPGPIIVTGCQRSGTMLASQIIAHGLGYGFLEEFDILPFSNTLNILYVLHEAGKKDVVIQAPFAIQKYRHILFAAPDTHFVGMVRPRGEILDSMRRIEWCKNDFDNWEEYIEQHVDKMIALWEQLKDEVAPSNWTELHYKDLKDHPFFVDKKLRKNFTVKQWHIDKPCNFKTWSDNKKCIEDRMKENIDT